MNRFQQAKNSPGLGWRSGLTIAPVVALIGFGSWFLWQEQRLARQEAIAALNQAGTDLVNHLEKNIPLFSWTQQPTRFIQKMPLDHPENVFVISVSPDGECLNPIFPHTPPLPTPNFLPWNLLDESLSLLWEETHQSTNTTEQLQFTQTFLSAQPPEPFDSLMGLTRINALLGANHPEAARIAIEDLRRNHNENVHSEAGLPLPVLLDLQELRIINQNIIAGEDSYEALYRFGSRQLSHPTPWTRQILSERWPTANASPKCLQLKVRLLEAADRLEQARAIYAAVPPQEWQRWMNQELSRPHWIEYRGTSFLVHALDTQGSRGEFIAVPESVMIGDCQRSLDQWSGQPQFNPSISIGGRVMDRDPSRLSDSSSEESTKPIHAIASSASYPWLQAQVALANPDEFFAQSRQRSRSLLLLMLLASVTGLVGWFAQRTAFRRQQALGEMKSNFVASVSHELRAPIASIRLMSENLHSQKQASQPQQKNYFKWIGLECTRLSSLVDNVLQFSRIEAGRSKHTFEPVDVRKLFEETMQLMQPIAINAQVSLEMSAPQIVGDHSDHWPDGFWDGQAVHQALVNLVDNAIKHTPANGTVTLKLELQTDQKFARFTISDQGPGIPPEDRERIFSPFERLGSEATRRTKGVGIGLSLVQHTAQAHGGTVTVHSTPNGGACFLLSLPLHSDRT